MANPSQPRDDQSALAPSIFNTVAVPRLTYFALQQRNKPTEAPKAPERAPFFLPTLPGVDSRFDFGNATGASEADKEKEREMAKSRRLDIGAASVETEFVRRMMAEDRDGDCEFLSLLSLDSR